MVFCPFEEASLAFCGIIGWPVGRRRSSRFLRDDRLACGESVRKAMSFLPRGMIRIFTEKIGSVDS